MKTRLKSVLLLSLILGFNFLKAQKIPIPSTWDVNVNGYMGLLVIQNYNQTNHEVEGTILGSNFKGHLVGRHLQYMRYGTDQIYEAWILDPALGAQGQSYYDGTLILAGNVVEGKANDGIYPFTARMKSNTSITTPIYSNINGKWQITCYGIGGEVFIFDMNLNQSGNKFKGDMIRTNGTDPHSTIEGRILANGQIEFSRKSGNFRQSYQGRITNQVANSASRMDGKFGDPGNLVYSWFAVQKK